MEDTEGGGSNWRGGNQGGYSDYKGKHGRTYS